MYDSFDVAVEQLKADAAAATYDAWQSYYNGSYPILDDVVTYNSYDAVAGLAPESVGCGTQSLLASCTTDETA